MRSGSLRASCGNGLDDLVGSVAHQRIELLAGATAFGSYAHHRRAAIRLCPSNSLDESASFQLLEHARHRAGRNSRTRCEVGNARAFLRDQRPQDRALALAQSFATDFVRADLPENAGEPLQFVPPFLDRACRSRSCS